MNKNTNTSGLGLTSVLTIVFVVLKLVGVIDWSWWWVFSPTLIGIAFDILLFICIWIFISYEDKKYSITPKKGNKDKWKF